MRFAKFTQLFVNRTAMDDSAANTGPQQLLSLIDSQTARWHNIR
ncbi:hypothetical protein OKW33_000234 [Paraburkholderia atlantica]